MGVRILWQWPSARFARGVVALLVAGAVVAFWFLLLGAAL